jgi:hypothetical protein
VVRTYTDIEEMVITTTEIERVLGDLGETPYDPLMEEKDEDVTDESSTDKQLSMLNEILIHFFRNLAVKMEQVLALLGVHLGVSYAKLKTTLQWPVQSTMICGLSAANAVDRT